MALTHRLLQMSHTKNRCVHTCTRASQLPDGHSRKRGWFSAKCPGVCRLGCSGSSDTLDTFQTRCTPHNQGLLLHLVAPRTLSGGPSYHSMCWLLDTQHSPATLLPAQWIGKRCSKSIKQKPANKREREYLSAQPPHRPK